jgi:hypothetical protein
MWKREPKHRRALGTVFALVLLAPMASPALAGLPPTKVELFADARGFTVAGERGWLDEGLGKARYGGNVDGQRHTGLEAADLSLMVHSDWSWTLSSYLHLQYAPEQEQPVDVVEAWVGYRPAPSPGLRFSGRAGLYFPHISREHGGAAWTTPLTITPSAANSWIGEEIRALGGEAKVAWRGGNAEASLTVGLFGFNDPAGTLLAFRGWALGDVKAAAFSRLPLAPLPAVGLPESFLKRQVRWVHPICEVDGRVGHHAALDASWGERLRAGAFYYDNGGDPRALEHQQYGWDTRFWNLYLEGEPADGLTLIAQYMAGVTSMGWRKSNGLLPVDVDYDTGFLLASRSLGRGWVTVRHDRFTTGDNSFVVEDDNNEHGTAWTVAIGRQLDPATQVILEYLRVASVRPARATIGDDPQQTQELLQLACRRRF